MNFEKEKLLIFVFLFSSVLIYSQSYEKDSLRGSFTYLLRSKPNTLYPNFTYQELFSLQVSDERSFFISEKILAKDSIFKKNMNSSLKMALI